MDHYLPLHTSYLEFSGKPGIWGFIGTLPLRLQLVQVSFEGAATQKEHLQLSISQNKRNKDHQSFCSDPISYYTTHVAAPKYLGSNDPFLTPPTIYMSSIELEAIT